LRKFELFRVGPRELRLTARTRFDSRNFQLDRLAGKWATDLKRDPADVHKEIERILADHTSAPLGGPVGEKIVNVLEVNLELHKRFGAPPS